MAAPESPAIKRPGRRDWPFSRDMEPHLDRLLETPPFSSMDRQRVAKLREILQNDTRLRAFKKGEIVVRQGDYGTSAFLMLAGRARVVLSPDLPASLVGRRERKRKPFLKVLAQIWSGRK